MSQSPYASAMPSVDTLLNVPAAGAESPESMARSPTPVSIAPRASTDLKRGDTTVRSAAQHQAVSNNQGYSVHELFTVRSSVVPKIVLPTLVLTAWAAWWTVAYLVLGWKAVAIPNQLIGIISFVVGLLLVFRTNTAYDRFWEARRLWGTMFTHGRNLSRMVWIHVHATDPKDIYDKHGTLNLILAYAVAVKHHLRGELGHKYDDLHNLLVHLPDYKPGVFHPDVKNLPLEISLHISSYHSRCRKRDLVDIPTFAAMVAALSGMVDCLSNFERIRSCPIPQAYSIHLKQTLFLYMLALPFQLVGTMGWSTIPIVFIAAFTLQGIEAIAGEIENPFGYDENDLRVEAFCAEIREELAQLVERRSEVSPEMWGRPVALSDPMFNKMVHLEKRHNAA